ncbi:MULTISPECIES: diacylglycerol/lipid kinase family protein [Microbacterium]|jgi:diacylglycerol kinase (ATP)|uniref:diacylglycerol/lipid kinase family protein n=1 Tax=Microbacterium TaxID=33882 RepID=UPI0010F8BBD5|nr:diacylglycerol kinase family protein [Microbacterium sp. 4NA327F11]MCK9918077.1 NAD(+)/NADH kinase [Microbacteriaceae bacterium K1510]
MTDPVPTVRRAALIYNPVKVDRDRLRTQVVHYSGRAGWESPLFFETTVGDAGSGQARAAVAAGASVVLVAGGDGTVRAVAEAMAYTGIPVTIVPSGTGNLLARNLRLTLDDPERVISSAFDGEIHPIDIGLARMTRLDHTVEEASFVVMAGMGLDAAMIANTRPRMKKAVGWVAYVDGAARSLPKAAPFRIVYQLDDDKLASSRTYSVLFANCGSLPAGIALIPDASIADGALDIVLIQPRGFWGWAAVWRRVWWDNSVLRRFKAGRLVLERRRDRAVRYLSAHGIDTRTETPQAVQLDGDHFGIAIGIDCRVAEGALLVTVPPGHDVSRW